MTRPSSADVAELEASTRDTSSKTAIKNLAKATELLDFIDEEENKIQEIVNGKNWIVEFWRVRGLSVVRTCLGITFTLHREEKYEYKGLGIDLIYLEQFAEEAIKRHEKRRAYRKKRSHE